MVTIPIISSFNISYERYVIISQLHAEKKDVTMNREWIKIKEILNSGLSSRKYIIKITRFSSYIESVSEWITWNSEPCKSIWKKIQLKVAYRYIKTDWID